MFETEKLGQVGLRTEEEELHAPTTWAATA